MRYKFESTGGVPLVPRPFKLDFWCYRTTVEERIGHKLQNSEHKVRVWKGIADYHQNAVLWDLPLLLAGYGVCKKAADPFPADTARAERRMRMRCGTSAQWHQPEVESMKTSEQVSRCLVTPSWFRER